MRRFVTLFIAMLLMGREAHAQSHAREWLSHITLTAAGTTAAKILADKPALGAVFGISYAAGHHYMTLRLNDWEVGRTGRGAAMIGPIAVGLALTLIFDEDKPKRIQTGLLRAPVIPDFSNKGQFAGHGKRPMAFRPAIPAMALGSSGRWQKRSIHSDMVPQVASVSNPHSQHQPILIPIKAIFTVP